MLPGPLKFKIKELKTLKDYKKYKVKKWYVLRDVIVAETNNKNED